MQGISVWSNWIKKMTAKYNRLLDLRWHFRPKKRRYQKKKYSYKPFDDKKAIFIHIPKCAGVAVSKAIFGGYAGGHATIEKYRKVFGPACFNHYFSFTIVRNPWDRLVSAYFFLKNGGTNQKDQDFFIQELSPYDSFEAFVTHWVNEDNIWKWHHFKPQYNYILDPKNRVQLDFIGYLENLESDFEYIKSKIGVLADLAAQNKSRHRFYQDYYTEKTKRIVEDVYSKDIALLNYDFNNTRI